jgi:hypothetical protein
MSRPSARGRAPEIALPGVNTLVRLTIGSGPDPRADPVASDVPSRIEDLVPADPAVRGSSPELFVAVPHYRGDVSVPRAGTACTVIWVTPQGVYELPTGFVERVVVGPVVWAWRLAVTGPAQRAQRRHYVRVSWTEPIVVDVAPAAPDREDDEVDGGDAPAAQEVEDDGPGEAPTAGLVHVTTLDLSEGGVRCMLPPPPLRNGQRVRVRLEVDGTALQLDGTVVRVRVGSRTPGAAPECETGIAFSEPDEYGDLLRRVVFSEQLRSRRAGVE